MGSAELGDTSGCPKPIVIIARLARAGKLPQGRVRERVFNILRQTAQPAAIDLPREWLFGS
jgi:hypothetical protein